MSKRLYLSISQIILGAGLLIHASVASAAETVSVPEPGPVGLLVLGGVALLLSKRFNNDK